jgi:hypothetical protein
MDVILLPLMPIFVAIVEAIVPLIPHIQTIVQKFLQPIVDWIVPKIKWIGQWLENADWASIETWVTNAGNTVVGWLTTLQGWVVDFYNWFVGLFGGEGFWANLKTWWTNEAWPEIRDWPVIKQIFDAVDCVKAWYERNQADIELFFADPIKFIEDWWNTEGADKANKAISPLFTSLATAIGTWFETFYDENIDPLLESVKTKLQSFYDTNLKGVVTAIGSAVVDFLNYFINSGRMETMWQDVTSIVSGVQSVVNAVVGVKNSMSDWGGNVVGVGEEWTSKPNHWYEWIPGVKQISDIVDGFLKYPIGGIVPKTGLYQLHVGEEVVRAGLAGQSVGNNVEQTNIFNITIGTSGSVDDLAREIETKITRSLSTIMRRA